VVILPFLLFFPAQLTYFVGAVPFEIGFAAIVLAVANGAEPALAKALSWRPIARLGRISNGLYLWNVVIVSLTPATGLVGVAVSFGIAEASYRWIETPFLKLKRRSGHISMVTPNRLTGGYLLIGGAGSSVPQPSES
jgi:peptidoglycan/LPS O-acetylase OafA/YrhL